MVVAHEWKDAMHYLIEQYLNSPFQCRKRHHRIQVNQRRTKLRYSAPDGTPFIIDCSDAGASFPPVIKSPVAERYRCSHTTHTLGGGRICLANSISGWDIDHILLYCDSWAKGIGIYKRTGNFPKNPMAVFNTRR